MVASGRGDLVRIGIVGGGVFGVASALELGRRGHQVELFERRRIPAPEAASTDISKAIRMEYGSATSLYGPLVVRALARWSEIERQCGLGVLHRSGVLFLASSFEPGRFEWQSWEALRALGREPQVVEAREARKRWPQFSWDGLAVGLYNPEGGWLEASRAVEALAACARVAGAALHEESPVEAVEDRPGGATLVYGGRPLAFDRVLVCAGPWVAKLVPQLSDRVRVTRQQLSMYRPASAEPFDEGAFPVWIYDMREEGWYGFPATADGVVKVALHRRSETVDPDVSREVDPKFLELSRGFVASKLPALPPESPVSGKVCLYTNSPRGDLVVDRAPGAENVLVAGLGSGHAFKFGPVLGELAADLVERDEAPDELRLGAPRQEEVW
jgi:sarcosine oxidase